MFALPLFFVMIILLWRYIIYRQDKYLEEEGINPEEWG